MKTYNDYGFVIKLKQFKEADKLVVFLSEQNGTIESVAKGISKPLSKKNSALDLLNLVKVSFYKTKGLDIITEVKLIDDYRELKDDLNTISYVFYLLELINKFSTVSENVGEYSLFDLVKELLLYTKDNIEKIDKLFIAFELKLFHIGGFGPQLNYYIDTGNPITEGSNRSLSNSSEIGYIQNIHSEDKSISDRIIKIQKYMINNNIFDIINLNIDKDDLQILRYINTYWVRNILEYEPKSLLFLNQINKN
jgi:DNA repair protein RecO (recombination protein O)